MKSALIAAGLVLAATALPATAAPWVNTALQAEGLDLHYASQADTTGQYTFAVSCVQQTSERTMFVVTPNAWEETTSYAPEVPTTFVMDATSYPNLTFQFMQGSGRETVVMRSADQPQEFDAVVAAIRRAVGSIEISYFTTNLLFSSEGSAAATDAMTAACEG